MDGWPLAYLITFSTYGSRLHGDPRLTVDRRHNQFGEPYIQPDQVRMATEHERLCSNAIRLTLEQQRHVESVTPVVCDRGGWTHHASSAAPDHVHLLVSAAVEGKTVRKILKRWLTEALNNRWPTPMNGWWTEGGSVKWIWNAESLEAAGNYVGRQRSDVLNP